MIPDLYGIFSACSVSQIRQKLQVDKNIRINTMQAKPIITVDGGDLALDKITNKPSTPDH